MKKKSNTHKISEWDTVIEPQSSIFQLKLKKVWEYRDLLFLFVRRDFVSFYKQTILGPIWFFIQPLFVMTVYIYIFSSLAAISTDGLPPPLFYLVGIIAWSYFAECLTKTANVFKENAGIFGKVYFPRLIMPLSIVVSSLLKLGVQMVLLIIVMIYYIIIGSKITPSIYILLSPLLIILMALQGLGLGMIISSLTNKYRDLALLLTFMIQLMMYATTVVYPLSSLSGRTLKLVSLNPMTPIIEGLRLGFLGHGSFSMVRLLYVIVITILIIIIGTLIFNKAEKNFIDTI